MTSWTVSYSDYSRCILTTACVFSMAAFAFSKQSLMRGARTQAHENLHMIFRAPLRSLSLGGEPTSKAQSTRRIPKRHGYFRSSCSCAGTHVSRLFKGSHFQRNILGPVLILTHHRGPSYQIRVWGRYLQNLKMRILSTCTVAPAYECNQT